MYPKLFGIPFLNSYGLVIGLGILVSIQVLKVLCRRTGQNHDALCNLVMALLVAGLVGARTWHVVEFWGQEFAGRPFTDVFKVWSGGLVFHGGFIAAAALFPVWCRVARLPLFTSLDMIATILPLAHAFGRVGCFLFGCCYGIHLPESSPFACLQVTFPQTGGAWGAHGQPVLPAQLFEAAALLLFFFALLRLHRAESNRRPGLVAAAYLLGASAIRFAVEFLRDDPRTMFGWMSIGQVTSLVLAIFAIPLILVAFRRGKQ